MLNIFLPAGNMQTSTKIVIFLLSIIFWYFERLWYVESHRLNFLNHKIIIFWPLGIRNRSQNGGTTILAYEGLFAHSEHWISIPFHFLVCSYWDYGRHLQPYLKFFTHRLKVVFICGCFFTLSFYKPVSYTHLTLPTKRIV